MNTITVLGLIGSAGLMKRTRTLGGPVYAAAVILPHDVKIEGLNDSKKLSEKKRELLYDEIIAKAGVFHRFCISGRN